MRAFTTSALAALVAVASLTGNAQAQVDPTLIQGLSTSCGNGLVQLLTTSNVSSCLALTNAVAQIGAAGNGTLVPGLNNYLTGSICGKPACSAADITSANTTLNTACTSDIPSNNGANLPALISFMLNRYDIIRSAACLQDSSKKNEICFTQTLYTLQNSTNQPVTLSTIQSLLSNTEAQANTLKALAANKTALCTDCNHALFSTVFGSNPAAASAAGPSSEAVIATQLLQTANGTCGASFVDGKIPSTIKADAAPSGTSSTTHNAAASLSPAALGFTAALGLFASGLALLA